MPLTLTYTDAYLTPLVTEARELRALADVDAIATFATGWREKLAVVRAYIIVCMESIKGENDVFSQKLTAYRKEWESLLRQATLASTNSDGSPMRVLSIGIERG